MVDTRDEVNGVGHQRKALAAIETLRLTPWEHGRAYASSDASFGDLLGLSRLGISYSEVPPGKSGCPYHNHTREEELFVILEGSGTYRFGGEEHAFGAGDVLAAPAGGTETAHQIINTGRTTLRYLSVSANVDAEIIEYPDSAKMQAKSRLPDGRVMKHMSHQSSNVDYWSGEPGAES